LNPAPNWAISVKRPALSKLPAGILIGLLDYVHIDQPLIMMGRSMGGGLAMDFALTNPSRALIMVDAGRQTGNWTRQST
jgi:pimeloyl-ACP methyl ester carboxylesterase